MRKLVHILVIPFLFGCEKREFIEIAQVVTGQPSDITAKTVTIEGSITDLGPGISNHGHSWSAQNNLPTIEDNKSDLGIVMEGKSYQTNLSELEPGITYFYRAYIISNGTAIYGEVNNYTTLDGKATVVTGQASEITIESAKLSGSVTSSGGDTVVLRGFIWGDNNSIDLSNNIGSTENGSGLGDFEDTITGLLPDSLYYFSSYGITTVDTTYGEVKSLTTDDGLPILTTVDVTEVTAISATSGGNITNKGAAPLTARGISWGLLPDPTIENYITMDSVGEGTYQSFLVDLQPGTTYYVRSYATNSFGTNYGDPITFLSGTSGEILSTKSITNITINSSISGGIIFNAGTTEILGKGVCWNLNGTPTLNDNFIDNGPGVNEFNSDLTGLQLSTLYYVRAYIIHNKDTIYGNELSFTTRDGVAILSTQSITNITTNSAETGGNITDDGGATITSRGVSWSTSQNPTISNDTTSNGTGIGTFVSTISGLSPGTTYYVRAYAINAVGIIYGGEQTFTSTAELPTLTTNAITNITATTAVSGGNITDNGGATITSRGVSWSTSTNPTILDNLTSDGTGIGSFVSSITGLSPGTTYYVRAYATNSGGVAYGNEQTFTAEAVLSTITTNAITNITATTAVSGGNITNDGGATITSRGVSWSTSTNPTISDNLTSDGTGIGSFVSSITGLSPETTYYVRAYATNSSGVAYGNEQTFLTDGPWVQKTNFGGETRRAAVGFSIGDKGYIGTGSGTGFSWLTDFWEYDPATNTWSQKADFGGTGRAFAVGFSIGDKGYIGTGRDDSGPPDRKDFWEYDPATNAWSQKADFGGTESNSAVGFSIGDKGYIGTGNPTFLNKDFWEYDPAINTWSQKADFGGTARAAPVGFSIGNKGYIGTGADSFSTENKDFWEYDPATNTWTQKADFGGTARFLAVGFNIGDKGYIGTGTDRNDIYKKDFWEYDPVANIWSQKSDFGGSARYYAVGFNIGDKGYIGTGNVITVTFTKDFWEYDPNADQ